MATGYEAKNLRLQQLYFVSGDTNMFKKRLRIYTISFTDSNDAVNHAAEDVMLDKEWTLLLVGKRTVAAIRTDTIDTILSEPIS